MNKIILAILAIIVVLFLGSYLLFQQKVSDFDKSISNYESKLLQRYLDERDSLINTLYQNDSMIATLYKDTFSIKDAIVKRDTIFNYFIFSKKIEFKTYSRNYLECLKKRCFVLLQNREEQKIFNDKLNIKLKEDHGKLVFQWLSKIGRDTFWYKKYMSSICKEFFPDVRVLKVNDSAFKEFDVFIEKYKTDKQLIASMNNDNLSKYKYSISKAHRSLNKTGENYFESNMTKKDAFDKIDTTFTFKGTALGQINYSFQIDRFDKREYQKIYKKALNEQYQNNSLYTGAMPYSNCYGSSNSCSGWNCSEIKVKTSSSSDVLVTIKRNHEVFRHAYVRANSSYTFNVPSGEYQTFFYFGEGWNPKKLIKTSDCNNLRGGFISKEDVGKDDPKYIENNEQLYYELIKQRHGNFNTRPSDKNEAF